MLTAQLRHFNINRELINIQFPNGIVISSKRTTDGSTRLYEPQAHLDRLSVREVTRQRITKICPSTTEIIVQSCLA